MPKRRNSKRTRTGGSDSANPGSYSDAASYALATAGSGNTQYNNVFNSSLNQTQGNGLVGLQGQTVGGRRRRRSQRRSRKGGVLGGIISTAIAPATLLAMQQSYKRKKGGKGTRRSRKQKGGLWSGIISKALTPFTLLAMQQSYRRKNSGNQTRRRS